MSLRSHLWGLLHLQWAVLVVSQRRCGAFEMPLNLLVGLIAAALEKVLGSSTAMLTLLLISQERLATACAQQQLACLYRQVGVKMGLEEMPGLVPRVWEA